MAWKGKWTDNGLVWLFGRLDATEVFVYHLR